MVPIVVVGDILVDVVVRLDGPLAVDSDTPARISMLGGGSAANVAAWLGVTGQDVTLVGRVGADGLGRAQEAELRALGVHPRLAFDPAHPTGACLVLVTADANRTMCPDPGASDLSPSDLPRDLFRPGSHLHLSGYALIRERSREAGLAAIAMARSAGMSVSVDASSADPLAKVGPENFRDWVAGINLLFANHAEAAVLTGESDPAVAAGQLARVAGEVVVKLGPEGALWADRAGGVARAPAETSTVVDTTGAGDAFCAGFLGSRLAGFAPGEALAAGARLAARSVESVGGRPHPRLAGGVRIGDRSRGPAPVGGPDDA